MSRIVSIASQEAPNKYRQNDILAYMNRKMDWNEEVARKAKFLYDRSGIQERHSVLPDFEEGTKEHLLYKNGHDPNVQTRLELFGKKALPLAKQAIIKCFREERRIKDITHLITVSCTGMSAPGLDIQLIKELNLSPTIERSSVNFMGCYASIHGLKQAHHIAQSLSNACVLVVSVELCTLHFQRTVTEDNTMANMLFADGAAAALVMSEELAGEQGVKGFRIHQFHSDVLFSGEEDMSWNISDVGFQMTLSSYVPKVLSADIRSHFMKMLQKADAHEESIKFWAIHPGGKAILETVAKQMNIEEAKLRASYEILRHKGNMSSATVLFVLQEILENDIPQQGDRTVATAFGPGLTVESMLLETL